MAISKNDFIAAIAEKSGVALAQAEAVLDAISDVTAQELATVGSVRVPGLANVEAKLCTERPGRNLRTDQPCTIPAAVRLRIRPSAPLETKFKAHSARAGT
jgi:nucleoid DNA-binding protein